MVAMNMTEAILQEYDSGTDKPAQIMVKLMGKYTFISIATINRVLNDHRKRREHSSDSSAEPKKKSPQELLFDEVHTKCRNCGFHIEGKPCVMPRSLCPCADDLDDKMVKLRNLQEAAKANREKQLQANKDIRKSFFNAGNKQGKKKGKQGASFKIDIYANFEADLDMLAEQEAQEEKENQNTEQIGYSSYMQQDDQFKPAPGDEDIALEDFADLLS